MVEGLSVTLPAKSTAHRPRETGTVSGIDPEWLGAAGLWPEQLGLDTCGECDIEDSPWVQPPAADE